MPATGKGLRYPANSSPFNPPQDYKNLADDTDDRLGGTVPTPTDLPASGNWANRLLWVVSTRKLYSWSAGAGWVVVGGQQWPAPIAHPSDFTPTTQSEYLYRDPWDYVHLAYAATYKDPMTGNPVIGTVPDGFRPGSTVERVGLATNGDSGIGAVTVTVQANGNITAYALNGPRKITVEFNYKVA